LPLCNPILETPAMAPALVLRTIDELDQATPPAVGPSPDWSLDEFFDLYFTPVYLKATMADVDTIAEYRSAIARWVSLIGRPPLRKIENTTCATFVAQDLQIASDKHKGKGLVQSAQSPSRPQQER